MSYDRDSDRDDSSEVERKKNQGERKRVIGEGMNSPDSTQVPLKAETGEPDLDAINGRVPSDLDDEDRASNS